MTLWRRIDRALGWFEDGLLFAALVIAIVLVGQAVVLRLAAAQGLIWGEEVARYALVVMVYIGLPAATRRGAHVRIDLLGMVRPSLKPLLERVSDALAVAFCAIFAWLGVLLVEKFYVNAARGPASGLPMWIPYLPIAVGTTLACLRFLQRLCRPRPRANAP